jgi:hypothetical protein
VSLSFFSLKGLNSKGWLLALPANIRLGWKWLAAVTNKLAYKTAVLRLTVKNIVPTLKDNLIKIYLSEFINSSLKARLVHITKENVYIYETA